MAKSSSNPPHPDHTGDASRHLHAVDTPPEPVHGLGAGDLENSGMAATIDLEPEASGEPVDPPESKLNSSERLRMARDSELRPVVPEWMAGWDALRSTL